MITTPEVNLVPQVSNFPNPYFPKNPASSPGQFALFEWKAKVEYRAW